MLVPPLLDQAPAIQDQDRVHREKLDNLLADRNKKGYHLRDRVAFGGRFVASNLPPGSPTGVRDHQ
jgi:hypothetical protein